MTKTPYIYVVCGRKSRPRFVIDEDAYYKRLLEEHKIGLRWDAEILKQEKVERWKQRKNTIASIIPRLMERKSE